MFFHYVLCLVIVLCSVSVDSVVCCKSYMGEHGCLKFRWAVGVDSMEIWLASSWTKPYIIYVGSFWLLGYFIYDDLECGNGR